MKEIRLYQDQVSRRFRFSPYSSPPSLDTTLHREWYFIVQHMNRTAQHAPPASRATAFARRLWKRWRCGHDYQYLFRPTEAPFPLIYTTAYYNIASTVQDSTVPQTSSSSRNGSPYPGKAPTYPNVSIFHPSIPYSHPFSLLKQKKTILLWYRPGSSSN